MRRLGPLALAVAVGATAASCSTAPTQSPRAQFLAELQTPGVHRFDAVQVGSEGSGLSAEVATCVANAFERDKWPLEAALGGKVPTQVDVKRLNQDVTACQGDPGTTTIGPFG